MNTLVKVEFNNDLRRLTLPSTVFSELDSKVREIFSIDGEFTLKYKDLDGDDITVSSDDELSSALIEFAPLKLRVFLSPRATSSHFSPSFKPIQEKVYQRDVENQTTKDQETSQPEQTKKAEEEQKQHGKRRAHEQEQKDGKNTEQSYDELENLFKRVKNLAETTQKVIQENPEIAKEAEEISKEFTNVVQGLFTSFQQQQQQPSHHPFHQFANVFGYPGHPGSRSFPCRPTHPQFTSCKSPFGTSSSPSSPFAFAFPSHSPRPSTSQNETLYPNLSETFQNMSVEDNETKFQQHLKTLNSMGFCDYNENLTLLKRFNGDVQKVVNYLLSQ